jgi:5-oxopent-3-ene-1,2,5-tricarboxylate decarboxylase/2-hydroxyhepta-2,4-diene-1,7-dioate isomerase
MSFDPSGTVYGTLMNFRSELQALGQAAHEPPYNAPPNAPVLYVKPANTWRRNGEPVPLPQGAAELTVGASVAMVMKSATEVAGYVLVTDFSLPEDSLHRPPVKSKAGDGLLAIGERLRARNEAGDPAVFAVKVKVNGELRQTVRFSELVRPAEQLLADVSGFMTLQPGDMLLLGCDFPRPRVRAGDLVEISMPALGSLSSPIVVSQA